MMAAGLLIDTFLVRSVFTPSIITLLGPAAGWPGRLRIPPPAAGSPPDPAATSPAPARTVGKDTVVTRDSPENPSSAGDSPSDGTVPAGGDDSPGSTRPPAGQESAGPGPGPAEPPGARRHKRVRRTVRIAASLLLPAGVLWGADAAARAGAQSAVARAAQQAERLGTTPAVTVHGTFFLPQARIRGRYSDVDITMRGLQESGLRIDQLTARLEGVHVALGPVITGNVPGIPVDHTREQATISYGNLSRYLAARGDPGHGLRGNRPHAAADRPRHRAREEGRVVRRHPVRARG